MNIAKTTLLMAGLTVLLVMAGNVFGGQGGMIFAFAFAVIMNFSAYWWSDKMVLRMYKAREVGPEEASELHNTVRTLATNAGLPMPRVYIIPKDQPNAFATGRNPENSAVAVTEGLLRSLSREEVAGVLGHELAHIKNRDILIGTVAATIAGAISMLANMAQWAMIFGGGGDDDEGGGLIPMIVMMIVAPIAAMLIQMAISRSREYAADDLGSKISGNPMYLSGALRKLDAASQKIPLDANPATAHMFIVSPLSGKKAMASLFSTHPPMEKRIERLESIR